ncbi:MAG: CYTH domain-containing protein [Candidatus Obscuribacter sp.]|nr:CYTH domain-containing protein [Candidatus Obscuribacter sp.]
MLEIERKFRLRDGESTTIPTRLKAMGFEATVSIEMTGPFFPPVSKAEMLRVRDELANGKHTTVVTIKEWVIIGNSRERREQEAGMSALARWFCSLRAN